MGSPTLEVEGEGLVRPCRWRPFASGAAVEARCQDGAESHRRLCQRSGGSLHPGPQRRTAA